MNSEQSYNSARAFQNAECLTAKLSLKEKSFGPVREREKNVNL